MTDRERLHQLVDALGDEEVVDSETAAKLDHARSESGEDVPLEEVRRRFGL